MKKTKQILGLPVISVSSGSQMGTVAGIVVSPEQGKVECLLLDRKNWYGEMRAISFEKVLGMGEFAVTITNGEDVFQVSSKKDLIDILEKDIQVVKSGVMTKTGEYIGTVQEYVISEKSGKILGCEVVAEDGSNFIVPGEKVVTYGSKIMVIEDGYEGYVVKSLTEAQEEEKDGEKGSSQFSTFRSGSVMTTNPVEIFEAKQRQYLAGKKASKRITGPSGQVIVEEGAVITEDVIEKALSLDKYIELTMNVTD
ncbi:MAG: PRC-barrel domain-containing protein [Bacillota bacterium]